MSQIMKSRVTPINWTDPNVIQIVSTEISNSPGNLKKAFRSIAHQIGCSVSAVNNQWYVGKLKSILGHQFVTGNSKVAVVNRKNVVSQRKSDSHLIHQVELSSRIVEGMKVVTVKQYYAI